MAKKNAEHRTKTTKETRLLRCQLTDVELLAAGQKLAEMLDAYRQSVKTQESVTKELKAKSTTIEAAIEEMQILVRNKSEIRKIPCVNVLDYTAVTSTTTRTDTGEIIDKHRMTEDEQSALPFDDESDESEAKDSGDGE